jgi:hypothetical protein
LDGVGHGRKIQDAITRREEMAGVIVGMKANVITRQHPLQNLTPNRQNPTMSSPPKTRQAEREDVMVPIDFTTGKGGVKKESDFNILFGLSDGLAEESWKDHEMVILDPD